MKARTRFYLQRQRGRSPYQAVLCQDGAGHLRSVPIVGRRCRISDKGSVRILRLARDVLPEFHSGVPVPFIPDFQLSRPAENQTRFLQNPFVTHPSIDKLAFLK